MLITALSPTIGYDKASAIAHRALDENLTLREAALKGASSTLKSSTVSSTQKRWLDITSSM